MHKEFSNEDNTKEIELVIRQYKEASEKGNNYQCRELLDKYDFLMLNELFYFGEKINFLEKEVLENFSLEKERESIKEKIIVFREYYNFISQTLKKINEIRKECGMTNAPIE